MVYKNKKKLITSVISSDDTVLDVGFLGQGINPTKPNWVHHLLKRQAKDVYGLDVDFDTGIFAGDHYLKASAEQFSFGRTFDVIFAGDIIEHLSNPGLFLDACARHMTSTGVLVITTPNCFNLFNLAEKISKGEPTVNKDHTCYFNSKTLKQLLEKNGWEVVRMDFLYSLDVDFKESLKKKILNVLYKGISLVTPQFLETIVITAKKREASQA